MRAGAGFKLRHDPRAAAGRSRRDRPLRPIGKIHLSLLGVGRVAAYAGHLMDADLDQETRARFRILAGDIASLQDHQKPMADNVQFPLDATLAFMPELGWA